jgi:hypothetical protein
MALEQEVNGPGQANSGKQEKQDQVHRSLSIWLEPETSRLVRGKNGVAGESSVGNPFRL